MCLLKRYRLNSLHNTPMTRILLSLACLLYTLGTAAQAVEPASTKQEIAHLFTTLEASGCQIKCADNVVQPSAPWFQAVLVKYRISKVK